ncbi:MAG TPA: sulfite exporter TauE/SafE family protein [Thermoanaerobaculia bacterium]|nr:sulfite exporter TauE/SafE family protein [Thermoanaerobaculia bacterium]
MVEAVVAIAAFAGGVIASLAGFGIGSLITPFLAMQYGMKLAVAMVAIPHVAGTALRFFFLRKSLDRKVLLTFGVTSALGGLTGAVLHAFIGGRVLAYLLAALLIFAGITGLFGITLKFGRTGAWIAGALSGLLGGLVGNQGGIRAGAMLGFDVPKEAFVATSTAVALLIDGARVPVYLYNEGNALLTVWRVIAIATVAVLLGTIAGRLILGRISEAVFKRVVSGLILCLGISMLFIR